MLIWEADTKFYTVGFFHYIKHEKSKYFYKRTVNCCMTGHELYFFILIPDISVMDHHVMFSSVTLVYNLRQQT